MNNDGTTNPRVLRWSHDIAGRPASPAVQWKEAHHETIRPKPARRFRHCTVSELRMIHDGCAMRITRVTTLLTLGLLSLSAVAAHAATNSWIDGNGKWETTN